MSTTVKVWVAHGSRQPRRVAVSSGGCLLDVFDEAMGYYVREGHPRDFALLFDGVEADYRAPVDEQLAQASFRNPFKLECVTSASVGTIPTSTNAACVESTAIAHHPARFDDGSSLRVNQADSTGQRQNMGTSISNALRDIGPSATDAGSVDTSSAPTTEGVVTVEPSSASTTDALPVAGQEPATATSGSLHMPVSVPNASPVNRGTVHDAQSNDIQTPVSRDIPHSTEVLASLSPLPIHHVYDVYPLPQPLPTSELNHDVLSTQNSGISPDISSSPAADVGAPFFKHTDPPPCSASDHITCAPITKNVHLGFLRNGDALMPVVWKRLEFSPLQDDERRSAMREIKLQYSMQDITCLQDRIVKIYAQTEGSTPEGNTSVSFAMEPMITNLSRLAAAKLSARQRVYLALSVADTLSMIHQQGVLHGDIKGLNFLVDAQGRVTVADFGLARHALSPDDLDCVSALTTGFQQPAVAGTLLWNAPEFSLSGPDVPPGTIMTEKSDVWSFGMTLFELITAQFPWHLDIPVSATQLRAWFRQRFSAQPFVLPRLPPVLAGEWEPAHQSQVLMIWHYCCAFETRDRRSMREICDLLRALFRDMPQHPHETPLDVLIRDIALPDSQPTHFKSLEAAVNYLVPHPERRPLFSLEWCKGPDLSQGNFGKIYKVYHTTNLASTFTHAATISSGIVLPNNKPFDSEECIAASQLTFTLQTVFCRRRLTPHPCVHPLTAAYVEHEPVDGNKTKVSSILVMPLSTYSARDVRIWRESLPDRRTTERQAAHVCHQALRALSHAHNAGVLHRNVNMGAMYLFDNPADKDLPLVQLSSWSFCCRVDNVNFFDRHQDTLPSMKELSAPELQRDIDVGGMSRSNDRKKTDVFHVGMVLYMLLGGVTFNRRRDGSFVTGFSYDPSPDLSDLLWKTLHADVGLRPTADELMHHSWFARHLPSAVDTTAL